MLAGYQYCSQIKMSAGYQYFNWESKVLYEYKMFLFVIKIFSWYKMFSGYETVNWIRRNETKKLKANMTMARYKNVVRKYYLISENEIFCRRNES